MNAQIDLYKKTKERESIAIILIAVGIKGYVKCTKIFGENLAVSLYPFLQ